MEDSTEKEPLLARNRKQSTLLRQRNIQIKAINDMDHSSSDDDTAEDDSSEKALIGRKVNFKKSNENPNESDEYFETYLVIAFSSEINIKTLHWIVDKIRGKRTHGGAELLIRKEPGDESNDRLILHISAKKDKFLQLADELEIMKMTKSGVMKNFNVFCLEDFCLNGDMDVNSLLTQADRQSIVKHALDNIKANEHEKHILGTDVSLYHGESIIAACLNAEIIESVYALHDKDFLKKFIWFGRKWYASWLKRLPANGIREYFGESVGIYFSFVEYYTYALVVPAILGIFQYFLAGSYVPFFCIFYVIWLTMFLLIWKRKCSALAYRWGTISMTNLDKPRIGFYGTLGKDPITGKVQPQYPIRKTYILMYCVSIPICILCMVPAAFLAIVQFWIEAKVLDMVGPDSLINYIPSIVQALIVALFSGKFEVLATWLTDKENHRTQAQYERHRVVKLIGLEFVNNFISLFYVAFWIQDINLLQYQLMTQLIVFILIQKLQGTLYPIGMSKFIRWKGDMLNSWYQQKEQKFTELNLIDLPSDDPRIKQNKRESTLFDYNSTYEDYLEMYIQFGYVVLFASIAPFAAFLALLNNIIEIRLDAFKLCKFYKRPLAKRAKNTGAWLLAFETLLVMSIITNCGLLFLQPEVRTLAPNASESEVIMAFVIGEHLLLAIAWAMNRGIPERPWWVRVALAKADYESRQALKREVNT